MAGLYSTVILLRLKELFRLPAYWLPTLLFPAMLFAMFGVGGSGLRANYAMASFTIYAVIGVAFFQFGVSIAQDRATQWERYRRTLPGAGGPQIVAQLSAALVFSLLSALLVIAIGYAMSEPSLNAATLAKLLFAAVCVAIPFTLLGVMLGYWTTAKSAVGIANMLYLPLAYVGGLWMPPAALPDIVAKISPYTPTRHAGEIVWAIAGGRAVPRESILWLAGYGVLFAVIAYLGYRRDEKRRYA